jgi:LysR family transcriptional regulator, glycine cleavage system transcriptional activator
VSLLRLTSPGDCRLYPLLHDTDRSDWRLWLRAHGVEEDPRDERGPSFDDDILIIRAAEAGQGVALVRDIYVREEIAAGRLCVALDCPQPTRFAYYAVTKPEAMQRPAVRVRRMAQRGGTGVERALKAQCVDAGRKLTSKRG